MISFPHAGSEHHDQGDRSDLPGLTPRDKYLLILNTSIANNLTGLTTLADSGLILIKGSLYLLIVHCIFKTPLQKKVTEIYDEFV